MQNTEMQIYSIMPDFKIQYLSQNKNFRESHDDSKNAQAKII